ncbi:ribosome biogenesis protein Ria1 [Kalaharituber pfeilii]|nr:ribosome biogenesis protein Ria1 [Kalaharituber pfeilii]
MPPITASQIAALQKNSGNIRNICILAHVDHGKTSLSDCLLATNGIISPKLAGKIRYLDSRPDEQLRGITMESSAISLFFKIMRRSQDAAEATAEEYLINLIDSPGHIDFSSEVSTASRLCDGALILVDAVEGVCSQTETVLRQTWIEHIRPILVINKLDRLITELRLTPSEAYIHISKLLEQVNAVMGGFFAGERMEEDLKRRERAEKQSTRKAQDANTDIGPDAEGVMFEEKDDEDIYFAPEKGNVIFSSAIDGWAFTVKQFASIYERKLGFKNSILEKVLWGDFYLDPKTKRVLGQKHLKGRTLKPMFVQLVLDSIWAVYESTVIKRDQEKIEKIVKSLNLKVLPREMKSKDTRALLMTIFSQWLPLSTAVLVSVIEQLPSPPAGQKQRIPLILDGTPGHNDISPSVRDALVNFTKSKEAPVVAYVSKMVAVPESELKKNCRVQLTAEEMRELGRQKRQQIARKLAEEANAASEPATDHATPPTTEIPDTQIPSAEDAPPVEDKERLIGFARLYSGTIKVGQELYVLGPKYNPSSPTEHVQKVTVTELYYMMGRDLQVLDEVPAGNVFGIGGLEGKLLKNGTLCSVNQGGVNFAGIGMGGTPIVRVALEPKNPSELNKMIDGLKMLEQADPCAEYIVQDTGEHVILTAGELHLERCLKDLRERFAKIEIQASPPIVPYRETIVSVPDMAPPKEKDKDLPRGTTVGVTPSSNISIKIQTRPLPAAVTQYLIRNSLAIKKMNSEYAERESVNRRARGRGNTGGNRRDGGQGVENDEIKDEQSGEANEQQKIEPASAAGGTTTAEPKEAATKNDLDENDAVLEANKTRVLTLAEFKKGLQEVFENECPPNEKDTWANVVNNIAAFGPRRIGPNILVDATGTGLFRHLLNTNSTSNAIAETTSHSLDISPILLHSFQLFTASGPLCAEPLQGVAIFIHSITIPEMLDPSTLNPRQFRGELLTLAASAYKSTFSDWSPRLLLAVYIVTILVPPAALGRVYTVITRRRGRILSEEMREGTPYFTITATLPVKESFGFSDELRKRTSGEAASPQMVWGGYEVVVDEDPWWTPLTEEELEDWGEGGGVEKEGVATVRGWVEEVRMRKGLFVQGRKLVVGAEKQKTLKR